MNDRFSWFYIVVVGWFFYSTTASAQVPPDSERRYKAAVRLVQTGNYERAKPELNAIIQGGGSLAPYANYYYALAAFKQKNFTQARLMLRQLMDRFPDWRKIDDANYLSAAVSMETGKYDEALTTIERIRDPELRPEIDKLERYFFGRIKDLAQLKGLQKDFPDNRNLGLALIDLIQRSSSDKDDLELSDRLTNRFGVPTTGSNRSASTTASTTALNGTASTVSTTPPTTSTATTSAATTSAATTSAATTTTRSDRSRPKGYYNVAIMFPFRLNEFAVGQRARSNQYVFDLYNGMTMARDKLKEEGITINLFAYDVENDATKTLDLLNSQAFKQMDLIIGPLYAEPNRVATDFANQNGMLLVNPIATNRDLIANQPAAYLTQPSVNRQAEKAAELARTLGGSRRAAVYFGTSRKDSLLAAAYQAELQRQGFQIVELLEIGGNAQAMASAMKISEVDKPGHVFFASSNDDAGAQLVNALTQKRINVPVIATSTAFDFYKNSISVFTRRELYLLYPDYIDSTRPAVSEFQEQYLTERNIIPSVFASQGYDMLLFFGRQLAKNGTQFRNRSSLRTDTDDYVMSGFDYTRSNENQVVPIVKWEGGRFTRIN